MHNAGYEEKNCSAIEAIKKELGQLTQDSELDSKTKQWQSATKFPFR